MWGEGCTSIRVGAWGNQGSPSLSGSGFGVPTDWQVEDRGQNHTSVTWSLSKVQWEPHRCLSARREAASFQG